MINNWYKQAVKLTQKNGIKIRKGQFYILPNRAKKVIKAQEDKDIINK